MELYNRLGNGQAQPGAPIVLAPGFIYPVESFEDARGFRRFDALAFIRNGNPQELALQSGSQDDFTFNR
ncbi:hypothetical protein D3C71_2126820 [compost metagenome]